MKRKGALAVVLLAAVLLPPAARPCGAAGWWSDAWPYRREITVEAAQAIRLAGDDIAVIEMFTGGLAADDGGDIRVATHDGREMPTRVLATGPGDTARVAFALQPGVTKYYAYFGNPRPQAGKPLEIRRGVLLEMWQFAGGGIRTLDQARRVIDDSRQFIGRDFRERIFQGHNPFGPDSRIACRWIAHFVTPKKGNYTFATSSQDASFLLIDDTLVVDNGGFHPPQNNISKQGQIDLEAGPHTMTFYHICGGAADPVAVVAWKTPDENAVKPMPAEAFAPVRRGAVGPIERYGGALEVDFSPAWAGESFVAGRYFQRYAFEARSVERLGRDAQLQWDFGDGQKSTDAKIEHVYLLPGQYTVVLTAKTYAGVRTRTNRLFVARPWDRVTDSRLDAVGAHASIVAKYDLPALSAEALAQAMVLFDRANQKAPLLSAGAALAAKDAAPAKAIQEAMPLYADFLIAGGQPRQAVDALLKGAKMTTDPAVCADLMVRAGRAALEPLDQAAKAQEIFEDALKRYSRLTTAAAIRQARIGVGDSWRARGEYEKAREAYTAAGVEADAAGHSPAVLRGDFARHVEDYIRQKDYLAAEEYLDRWENAFPLDRLEGYSTLMRVRLAAARSRHADAARQAEALVKVHPASSYAPELLMLAGDAYIALRQDAPARAAWKRVADDYRESPFAPEAKKKLGDGK